jgi:hypothetical protein
MERKVNIIEGLDGKKVVFIHDRHAGSGKKYLYDIMEIKKETSNCCQE